MMVLKPAKTAQLIKDHIDESVHAIPHQYKPLDANEMVEMLFTL